MEGLKPFREHLQNLWSQTEKLIDARLGLNALFAEEETRLQREDEASTLEAVYGTIAEKLKELRGIEDSASYQYSRTDAISYVPGLVREAIVSKDNRASAVKNYLVRKETERKRPFGLVMVCIGGKGLPDDVKAVSISELARRSSRQESEVISKLRERGHLLLSEEAFSRLIDKLIADVEEGQRLLPVGAEKPQWVPRLEPPQNPQPSP